MSEKEHEEEREEEEPEYSCKHCKRTSFLDGTPFKGWTDVGRHVRSECTKYVRPPRKTRRPTPGERADETTSVEEAKAGPPDLGTEPTEVLENFLKYYTDLHPKSRDVVVKWAGLQPGIIHPTTLAGILVNELNLKTAKANIIAQKYSLALQKVQTELQQKPPMMFAPTIQHQQPTYMFPGQPPQWPPQQWRPPQQPTQWGYPSQWGPPQYPPRPLDPNEVAKKAAEEATRQIKSDFESRFRQVENAVHEKPAQQPYKEQMVESYEPVRDKDGSIVKDADGSVVIKKVLTPVSVMKGKDPLTEVYRLLYENSKKTGEKGDHPSPLTKEEIKEIVREATAKEPLSEEKVKDIVEGVMEKHKPTAPPTDPRITNLQSQLTKALEKVEEMGDKMEEQEKQFLLDKIGGLQGQLNTITASLANMPTGEWKSDEFKALATAVHELTALVKDRKPVEAILDKGPRAIRMLTPGMSAEESPELDRKVAPQPQPQPAPTQPPEKVDEVATQLRKHGYSVRLE